MVPILYVWVFLVSSVLCVSAQKDTTATLKDTTAAKKDTVYRPPTTGQIGKTRNLDELEAIKFVGCDQTSSEELLGVIQSRESELSFTRQLAVYYYENVQRNPATPEQIEVTLAKVQKDLEDELRYFNPYNAIDDSVALMTYLYQNGYHNATVNWTFGFDSSSYKNTLTFFINEKERATIDTIIYVGLDSVPPEVMKEAEGVMTLKIGDPFSESSFAFASTFRCGRISLSSR
jgi:outer membrane protein assembly factor BamA